MKTLLSFLLCLSFVQLYSQIWNDKDFKKPSSLKVGMFDTIPIFSPEGVKLVEIYGNARMFYKKDSLKKGDAYIGRVKFNDDHQLISDQAFLLGSYSVENDRLVGFHTETYEHSYPNEKELVIGYANTKELKKYKWFYSDSLLQESRYYLGEYPFLQAFWKWDYTEDGRLASIAKFDADTVPQYYSSYSYTDFGEISQIQTTVGKNLNYSLFEYNEDHRLSSRTFFKKLKHVPRELYEIKGGVFVRKRSIPIGEEKLRALRRIYHYDEEGRLAETIELNKRGDLIRRITLSYTPEGKIESKLFVDAMERTEVIYYNYNDEGRLVSIDHGYKGKRDTDREYTFDYDNRGNVRRCHIAYGSWYIRMDFDYEYVD